MQSPRLVHEVKPTYTREAMQAGIEGVVLLEALILEDGTVGETTIVQSLDPVFGLDDTAVDALSRWQFAPGTRDGEPVPVLVEIEMRFTLK